MPCLLWPSTSPSVLGLLLPPLHLSLSLPSEDTTWGSSACGVGRLGAAWPAPTLCANEVSDSASLFCLEATFLSVWRGLDGSCLAHKARHCSKAARVST